MLVLFLKHQNVNYGQVPRITGNTIPPVTYHTETLLFFGLYPQHAMSK